MGQGVKEIYYLVADSPKELAVLVGQALNSDKHELVNVFFDCGTSTYVAVLINSDASPR